MSPLLLAHCPGVTSPDTATLPCGTPSNPDLGQTTQLATKMGRTSASAGLLGTPGSPAPVSLIPTMSQGPYGPPGDGFASPWLCVPTALPGTVLPSWHHWVQPAYTSCSDTILEPSASDPTLPMSPQERDWPMHSSLHLLSLSRLHTPQHTHIEGPCVRGAAPGGDTVYPMSGPTPASTEGHVVCEGGPGAQ